jgi:hypothetical protein
MSNPARLLVVTILTVSTATAFGSPPMGSWRLNTDKSHYEPGPAPLKSFTLKFEPAEQGMYRVTATGEMSDGAPIHTTYVLRDDGKDYPVANAPFDTISVKRIDANSQSVLMKLHGKMIQRTRVVFRGSTMTETGEGIDPSGRTIHSVEVLEKQ